MILSDFDLKAYLNSGRLRIEPFTEEIIRENGLDFRLGREFCELLASKRTVDLTKRLRDVDISELYKCYESEVISLKPNTRYLLHTVERVTLPPELMAFVELRSTFARLGLIIPPTIVDGGFSGQLTIELLNTSFPIKIPAGTRFLHVVFAKLTTPVTKPYRGRYQGQTGVTLPRLESLITNR
ncbi:MAG: dCTP deaminase [Desulfurococcales archaeon ex4484_204]|nr:MAG: dCTP deaminase [Desulfurococcales archaeon ex4484_204]